MFDIVPIIAILASFGVPAVVIIVLAVLRHRQRMELIRQGIRPESDAPAYPGKKSLLWGMILTGLGLAAMASGIWDPDQDLRHFGILFLGAGIALLAYWKLTAPDRERQIRLYEERMLAWRETSRPAPARNLPTDSSEHAE